MTEDAEVERVARAICEQASQDDGYAPGDAQSSIELGMWKNHVAQARAAIAKAEARS